jgi:hypothetical protein
MFNPKLKASNLDDFNLDQYTDIVLDLAKIDKDAIEEELLNFTAYFSYYYGLQVRAKRILDNANVSLESIRSCKKTDLRNSNVGKKKPVDALNDEVNCDEDIKTLNNNVSKYEEIYGLMRGICLTLDHKKDMLVQLSANKRQEIKLH